MTIIGRLSFFDGSERQGKHKAEFTMIVFTFQK